MRKFVLALAFVLTTVSLAAADTIYMRDGRTIRGTVLGFISGRVVVRVGGTTPASGRTRTPAADDGELQFIRPRDIERIEIDGRSLDEARFETRTVEVALAPNWIDSGVDVRRGERVQVTASGTIVAGRTRITPDGLRSTDPTAPLPRAAEGTLIGAVSNDPDAPIIELGLSREFIADRDGRLYLTANRGTYTDARGSYSVQVRKERDLAPRRTDTAGNAGNNRRTNDDDEDTQFDPFGTSTSNPAPTRPRTPTDTAPTNDRRDTTRTPQEKSLSIPGTSRGVDTGIDLRAGDQVMIDASGEIIAGRRAGSVSPEGGRGGFGAVLGAYPVPDAGVGALIGYIRLPNGQLTQPFLVGRQLSFASQVDGRLILLVNDDNYNDNGGNFSVRIRY